MKVDYHADLYEDTCYHIYNRSISGVKLFSKEEDYLSFLDKYKKYLSKYLATYSYFLAPDHFHFLVKCEPVTDEIRAFIKEEKTKKSQAYLEGKIDYNEFLVSQFKRFFNSHSKSLNHQLGRHGSMFQKKFKRISIKNREHFKFMVLYIHHNVLHHKLGKNFSDYKFSSYRAYLSDAKTMLSRKSVYDLFSENESEKIKAFTDFHEANRAEISLYPNLKKMKHKTIDYDL